MSFSDRTIDAPHDGIDAGTKTNPGVPVGLPFDDAEAFQRRKVAEEEAADASLNSLIESVESAVLSTEPDNALDDQQTASSPHRNDDEYRDHLVCDNLDYATALFAHTRGQYGLDMDDLVQEVSIGLLDAAERFDPTRGTKFMSYAPWRIRSSIRRRILPVDGISIPEYVQNNLQRLKTAARELRVLLNREPSVKELALQSGFSEEQVDELLSLPRIDTSIDSDKKDKDGKTLAQSVSGTKTEPDIEALWQSDVVRRVVNSLPPRQREVIRMGFGLDGEDGRTLPDIAATLGVSISTVKTDRQTAITKLREELQALGIREA